MSASSPVKAAFAPSAPTPTNGGGHDTIVEAFKAQLQGPGTRKGEPGDLNAFAEGSEGWAADRRTMCLTGGKEIAIRETFLFHQEDGDWKLVQFHASIAVANTQLAGQDADAYLTV